MDEVKKEEANPVKEAILSVDLKQPLEGDDAKFVKVVNDSENPADHGFQMGVDPGAPEGDPSGLDGEPAPALEMIGEIKMPPPKPKEPEENHAKVVGAKGIAEATAEEWSSYIVGLENPETKEYEEYFVPKNAIKLLSALEGTLKNKGESYTKVQTKIFKLVPHEQLGATPLALKLQIVDKPLDAAIKFVSEFMVCPPNKAYQAMLGRCEATFEFSDCIFVDIVAYFKSKGATGLTLMTPHFPVERDDAVRYYNALVAHVEMFKDNMKKQGIDIDKGSIITSSGGFKVKK